MENNNNQNYITLFKELKTYSFIANCRYDSWEFGHLSSFNKNRLPAMIPKIKII